MTGCITQYKTTGKALVSFYLLFGAILSLIFKKVKFYNNIKFCEKLADQPGSVMVQVGC